MRGDIDNTSCVALDGSPSARSRVVYGVRRIPEQRIQVGYVQVDYRYVVVWRPYDPENESWEAPWKTGMWRNAYALQMPREKATDHPQRPTYDLVEHKDEGLVALLPRVSVHLQYDLREHLLKLRGGDQSG